MKNVVFNASKLTVAVLFCAAVSFAGCKKLDSFKDVNFSVVSQSNPLTKTVYGDDVTYSSKNYQFVDWVNGDKIRVVCDQTDPDVADYTVTKASHDGIRCKGTVASASPLFWGEGQHTFYAVYPSPATDGAVSTIDGKTVTGSIPAVQPYLSIAGTDVKVVAPDMKNQYMVAKAVTEAEASSVVLDFQPLTTALEFTVTNGFDSGSAMIVKSITLSSAAYALNGAFSVDIDGAGVNSCPKCTTSATASSNNTVTINFSTPVEVAKGKSLQFTFFLNPGNGGAAGVNDITFTINGTNAGTSTDFTRSAKLYKTVEGDIAFPTHKKTRIKGLVIPEAVEWDIEGTIFVTAWENGVNQNIPLE